MQIESEILRTPIYSTDFGRYYFSSKSDEAIIFPYDITDSGYKLKVEDEIREHFPKAYHYLASQRKALESRKQFMTWYSFSAPRNLDVHAKAQILVPLLANVGSYCLLPKQSAQYCLMASGGFSITIDSRRGISSLYALGLLNSKLLFWRLRSISNVFRGGWITCTKQYVETLPIRPINFSDAADRARHERMVALVERMLALHRQLHAAGSDAEREVMQRQVEATDRQIDELVYALYGLSEDEIRIVEGE